MCFGGVLVMSDAIRSSIGDKKNGFSIAKEGSDFCCAMIEVAAAMEGRIAN